MDDGHGLCAGEGDEDEEASEQGNEDDEDGGSDDSDELLDVEKKARRADEDRWAFAVQSADVAPFIATWTFTAAYARI